MIYKKFQDLELSALGLGCMRLPTVDGQEAVIDETKTAEMVEYARNHGINYFDTAWFYHGGNSETVMGKVLSQYPRESFYLASKFPGLDPEKGRKDPAEIFEKQLEKCQTEYFDFYLVHIRHAGKGHCNGINALQEPECPLRCLYAGTQRFQFGKITLR